LEVLEMEAEESFSEESEIFEELKKGDRR